MMKKLLLFALALTALVSCSKDDIEKPEPEPSYYYKVTVVGSLAGVETGRVECTLASGNSRLSDWKQWDLSALGEVDCLTFVPESDDSDPVYGLNVPAYFAVDEIVFAGADAQSSDQTVSFETSEQMADFLGEPVVPGDIEVVGGWTAGTYHKVFWADPVTYADYLTDVSGAKVFDNVLFGTSDGNIWFGSRYSDNANWGERSDSWAGFVVAANYAKTATAVDFKNQFTVWADKGAKGTENCLVGYYDAYSGGYGVPMIELITPRKVRSLYMANSAVTYCYKPTPKPAASGN